MAREAGMTVVDDEYSLLPFLKRFEALVRADEREEFQRWFVGVITQHEQLILAEREACAKEADKWSKRDDDVGAFIGKAIRARGQE
jgi:hypothetical protein